MSRLSHIEGEKGADDDDQRNGKGYGAVLA